MNPKILPKCRNDTPLKSFQEVSHYVREVSHKFLEVSGCFREVCHFREASHYFRLETSFQNFEKSFEKFRAIMATGGENDTNFWALLCGSVVTPTLRTNIWWTSGLLLRGSACRCEMLLSNLAQYDCCSGEGSD